MVDGKPAGTVRLVTGHSSHLSHKIFTTFRTHVCRVGRLARNVKTLTRFVGGGLPVDGYGHLAGQNDVGRDVWMLVLRIVHIRPVLPDVYVIEPLILQLLRQLLFIHYSQSPGAFSESSACTPLAIDNANS